MELEPQLAQSIVDKMMNQLPFNVNMMNKHGVIIASGDPSRINSLHVGAQDAIKQRKTLTMASSYGEHGQPGVNMPVFFGKSIIGVIGITGDPKTVLPFASLLRTATELLLAQNRTNEIEKENENHLNRFLYQWSQIKDDISNHTALMLDAKELHIDLTRKRVAIAIDAKKCPALTTEADDYNFSLAAHKIIILTTHRSTVDRCIKLCKRRHLHMGVGRKTTSVGISINEALKTLDIAAIFQAKNYLYFDQVEFMYALLQSNLPVQHIVDELKALNESIKGKELIETLLCFIENNQNINETAAALHVHRNTLNYRLNKLTERLNLNPHKLIDLFQLYVGYLYFSQQTLSEK
ncbi:sugar diacid utilization regulator [Agrilactobacillus composti DSM 18527 = JCM 14202]|uniref:Sugar diacid utilization regulator n=1 Tax=Agrilactobacillus composti DSM 18527 = JCM 14202 TaxID=1423734 RepID=X0PRI6_9LACO|nr:sugar diacid recognition domain-containing protein [Agrilactobacillus composti]KRM30793.1 sugar diacid utilization regulator [Agrilactobacillus composti DSM 18527 = JCM 14202]GAF39786.1 sugar diacid utilization regulator SdaR [Agrilactobacillus composti DSM 18527 = JCM 14202]